MPNNVNQAELAKFVEAVKRRPEEAQREKVVEVAWNFKEGAPQASAELKYSKGTKRVEAELPAFSGGWGTSPDPIQYCLFGLAACFAVTLAATATAEGVPLTELRVKAENRLDLRKQLGLSTDPIIQEVRFTVTAASRSRAPSGTAARAPAWRIPPSRPRTSRPAASWRAPGPWAAPPAAR